MEGCIIQHRGHDFFLDALTISWTAEALIRPRGVDAALRAGPGHVQALVHVVALGGVIRPRDVTHMAAALEAHLIAVNADVCARVGVAALVPGAGVLVREVAAVVEAVADALPGDAGAVLAAELLPALAARPHRRRRQVDHLVVEPDFADGAVFVAAIPAVVDAVAEPLERDAAAVVGAGVAVLGAVVDVVAEGLVRLEGEAKSKHNVDMKVNNKL